MTDYADTPVAMISRLDAALARHGEDVVLRRVVKRSGIAVDVDVTCRVSERPASTSPVVGSMVQEAMHLVLSPSAILAAGWPGADENEVPGSAVPPYLPRANDTVFIRGKRTSIKAPGEIFVAGVWVRSDLVVAG